jgi:large subunit ribosomal protein L25
MAEMIHLKVKARDSRGSANARRLRRDGLVPAVLYGKKKDNVALAIEQGEIERAVRAHAQVLTLELPGGGSETALVKEIQYDNLNDLILHVDFGRVDLSEQIEVEVGLKFFGDAKGVLGGGHLETNLYSLALLCRADAVPDEIRVDLTQLGLNESYRVKDIKLPEGTRSAEDPEAIVVACRPATEVVEEPAPAEGPAEPEVLAKGKKEKEGEGEAAGEA